jgi:hypothetical protein
LAGYSYGHRDRRFAAQDGERSIGNANKLVRPLTQKVRYNFRTTRYPALAEEVAEQIARSASERSDLEAIIIVSDGG